MGKKKNKNNHDHDHGHDHDHDHEEKKEEVQKKGGGEEGDKKKEGNKSNPSNVVFKIEMHCEGCASKIIKLVRGFEGVESVKADAMANKLTVMGKVDPIQIHDFLISKIKKKVELISPLPQKGETKTKGDNNRDDNQKANNNAKKPDNADTKKPKEKEAPVITAVIKVAFHCMGCIEKIHKIVSRTNGVQEMTFDKQKETVTVKGNMDVKALTEVLRERLKRNVEIVPPKKEKDKDGENGGGDGGKKKKGGSGGGVADGGDKGAGGDVGAKMEGNRMEHMIQPGFGFGSGYGYISQPVYGNGYTAQPMPVPVPISGYGNGYMGVAQPMPVYDYGYGYGHGYVPGYPVHMKFNDENPNACSIM